MSKVYLLTDGEYSDYTVVAAFSTRELAEQECARWMLDPNRIEEYDLDAVPERLGYTVRMSPTGDHARVCGGTVAWPGFENGRVRLVPWDPPNEQLVVMILAKTPEQALKAANEKRAQWIAAGGLDEARAKAEQ